MTITHFSVIHSAINCALTLALLTGCGLLQKKQKSNDGVTPADKPEDPMSCEAGSNLVTEIDVYSSRFERTEANKIGRIVVENNRTVRVISSSGNLASTLKKAVDEMNAKEVLPMESGTLSKDENGGVIMGDVTVLIPKGDQQFSGAVQSYLASDYKFGATEVSHSCR